ncbi:MAG TPA: LptA/OstA family protein, partial [Pyrinomonadaceae bacterium]|nr:LptA/OstA family protein [Pyrinomonadaceae bacterium]
NYDHATMRLDFSGGATAEQGRDVMSGQTLSGFLNEQKKVRLIEARGQSYLRTMNEGRAAEVSSANMDFNFDGEQRLVRAVATSNVNGRTLDADSEVAIQQGGNAFVDFNTQGAESVLKQIHVEGRPVVTLAAPKSKAGDPAASNKRLTADSVKLNWRERGRDLERAEAVGNADLLVEPANPTPESDKKILQAPRFDCEFFETGNLARNFVATGGARAVVEPLQPSETRATRTVTSERMTAAFERETQAVEKIDAAGNARFQERARTLTSNTMTTTFAGTTRRYEKVVAEGNAKFNEADRNAQSATMTYAAADEVVRLRGGEPVVWDARARMKATEIDSDARRKISYGRGKVATTYYSREQTGGAAPFQNVKSPVFIASANAEFRHDEGVAIYTGGARAWQDDNFVKADRIILRRETKRMEADGSVQSALYNARRKEANGARTVVPVFATSRTMFFDDTERLLHYEGDVDIKQGTERITSEVADVYLATESYETERTVAQRNVVVTQPGKRGTGDWAQYSATDETVELRGVPARVVDAEKGTNEGRRMLVYLREDRLVTDGGQSPQSSGRVRTTHKVKKQ